MFRLSNEEFANLRSQIVISTRGGTRYPPRAFSEHGILMLSNVLQSERAVSVSIQIIRVFNTMREMVQGYQELIDRPDRPRSGRASGVANGLPAHDVLSRSGSCMPAVAARREPRVCVTAYPA